MHGANSGTICQKQYSGALPGSVFGGGWERCSWQCLGSCAGDRALGLQQANYALPVLSLLRSLSPALNFNFHVLKVALLIRLYIGSLDPGKHTAITEFNFVNVATRFYLLFSSFWLVRLEKKIVSVHR